MPSLPSVWLMNCAWRAMNAPKCRICGMREFGHRCQEGSAAQQVEENARVRARAREGMEDRGGNPAARDGRSDASGAGGSGPPPAALERERLPKRKAWTDDTDAAGEPVEVREMSRQPARFYAPPGSCVYCDRRRAAAAKTMRAVRERGEA